MSEFQQIIDMYQEILNNKHKKIEEVYSHLKCDIKYFTDLFRVNLTEVSQDFAKIPFKNQ